MTLIMTTVTPYMLYSGWWLHIVESWPNLILYSWNNSCHWRVWLTCLKLVAWFAWRDPLNRHCIETMEVGQNPSNYSLSINKMYSRLHSYGRISILSIRVITVVAQLVEQSFTKKKVGRSMPSSYSPHVEVSYPLEALLSMCSWVNSNFPRRMNKSGLNWI